MSTQTFLEKCRAIFQQANGGQPLTVGSLAAEMFLEIDKNQDRLISWEEFEKALLAKDPKEVTRAELEEVFKSVDKDGSGKLNKNEVKRLCQESGLKLSDERLDELINEADHNNDGEIGYEEFLQTWFNSS
ncbi:unnamed protein product [Candidula unifasciata]|uniref:EF-hand domain-containing protein n=1 Tax=Candidula unifasciata TaxID=100452 RepID=A0A8S3ZGD2_9EUPU|nr:unnamed protein product [Candidula unifasciata]